MKERSGGAPKGTVNIVPGVQTLGLFKHYDYTPWQALAEFVDNSISSWQEMRAKLEAAEGKGFKLTIKIELDPVEKRLRIVDNAGGIGQADYDRAFTLAAPPRELTRMNQFGVGMKVAACWFADHWQVRTSALGEPLTSTVLFNVPDIIENSLENLPIDQVREKADAHFTEIVLWGLHRVPTGSTLKKIGEHLTKMYRKFIAAGSVNISWLGEKLAVKNHTILTAPFYKNPAGSPREWKMPLDFKLSGLRITGAAKLFDPFKRSHTGLNLFWRDRLIKGNFDPYYRPPKLFGGNQSFKTGRLYIELDMDAFQPTTDRANIDFSARGCSEEDLLEAVHSQLSKADCPLLLQGENYRANKKDPSMEKEVKEQLAIVGDVIHERGEKPMDKLAATTSGVSYPAFAPSASKKGWEKTFQVKVAGEQWMVTIEFGDGPVDIEWVGISETDKANKRIGIKLGMLHPFNKQFLDDTTAKVIIRLAAALAFAELAARKAGAIQPSLVRSNMDTFLRLVLSEPED